MILLYSALVRHTWRSASSAGLTVDILKQVQWRLTKTRKGLKHLLHGQEAAQAGPVWPGEGSGPSSMCANNPDRGCKGGARLFSAVHTNWSTGNSIHTQGILFCAKGDKTLKHVSQPVRVSVPGDIQNPTGPGCRQPPVAGPALGLY